MGSEMHALAMLAVRDGFAQPGLVDKIFALSTDELCEFWAEVAVIMGDLMNTNLGAGPVAAVFNMVSKRYSEDTSEREDLAAQRTYAEFLMRVKP